jgi:Mrp family chromosome partitioning ATPase
LELADVAKSLRLHWRVCIAIVLLTGLALALFLITRKQVAPAARYRASIQMLVPAIDSQGNRPAGVPPNLLQGQIQRALNKQTESAAMDLARIPANRRKAIAFDFTIAGAIYTLSATAPDAKTASAAVSGFRSAYADTRAKSVADSATTGTETAQSDLGKLRVKLKEVEQEIGRADPNLLHTLQAAGTSTGSGGSTNSGKSGASAAPTLSEDTPPALALAVVQRETILSRIQSAYKTYADNSLETLLPGSFSTVVEVDPPVRVTPPPPSPFVPILVFAGIGLLLAVAVPMLIERLDRSIRSPKSAGSAFDATVLASIPATSRRLRRALAVPGTPQDFAYRALAATSVATDRLPQAIVVMSPTGDVQDSVAANFAAALAGLGLRVALIATDPRQAWFLDTRRDESSNGSGDHSLAFPQLLELAHEGRLNGHLPLGLVKTRLNNLLVMPPGEADDFSLDGLRPLLEALSAGGVDVTVIAGPSLLEDPNATILAWTTRCVLWACETGELTEGEAKEAAARLALAGASSFGVTMVDGKT